MINSGSDGAGNNSSNNRRSNGSNIGGGNGTLTAEATASGAHRITSGTGGGGDYSVHYGG